MITGSRHGVARVFVTRFAQPTSTSSRWRCSDPIPGRRMDYGWDGRAMHAAASSGRSARDGLIGSGCHLSERACLLPTLHVAPCMQRSRPRSVTHSNFTHTESGETGRERESARAGPPGLGLGVAVVRPGAGRDRQTSVLRSMQLRPDRTLHRTATSSCPRKRRCLPACLPVPTVAPSPLALAVGRWPRPLPLRLCFTCTSALELLLLSLAQAWQHASAGAARAAGRLAFSVITVTCTACRRPGPAPHTPAGS